MKKVVFLLSVMAFVFASCGDNADKVNKGIIAQVEEVNAVVGEISQNISNDEYDLARAAIDTLVVKVASSQAAIQLFNNKKAGVYKQAAVDYISFIGKKAPSVYGKAMQIFEAAKIREQEDVASGKQSPNMVNSGPDFDEGRKLLKDFVKELKQNQEVLIEKQDKFRAANGLN